MDKYPHIQNEKQLLAMAQQGDQHAKDALVQRNLGLVHKVARQYFTRSLSYPDMVQEGIYGLLTAINRFDLRKENKFCTYACWWIRHHVSMYAAENQDLIKKPVYVQQKIAKIKAVEARAMAEGRTAQVAEIGESLGMPDDKVVHLSRLRKETMSLEDLTFADSDEKGESFIVGPDNVENTVVDDLTADSQRAALQEALEGLTDMERRVVMLKYGLRDEEEKSLSEVGRILGRSRERVRQLQESALRKMRTPLVMAG